MSATSNKSRMEAAVERWINEAQAHPKGAEHLRNRASWLNGEIAVYEHRLASGREVQPAFVGLTAFDLTEARERLSAAAEKLAARPVALSKAA